MDTNQIQAAIATLAPGYLEQVRNAAYYEGRLAGRKEACEKVRAFYENFEEDFPIDPAEKRERQRRHRKSAVETAAVWLTPDEIKPLIKDALAALQAQYPDGAGPQLIAEQLRPNGQPVNVQAVRQALRQLTMQGDVRRVAHARYLPAAQPEAVPQPEAAE